MWSAQNIMKISTDWISDIYSEQNIRLLHLKMSEYCQIKIHDEDTKILNYNHNEPLIRLQCTLYANMEELLEKMNSCKSNLEKIYLMDVKKLTVYGFSILKEISQIK